MSLLAIFSASTPEPEPEPGLCFRVLLPSFRPHNPGSATSSLRVTGRPGNRSVGQPHQALELPPGLAPSAATLIHPEGSTVRDYTEAWAKKSPCWAGAAKRDVRGSSRIVEAQVGLDRLSGVCEPSGPSDGSA